MHCHALQGMNRDDWRDDGALLQRAVSTPRHRNDLVRVAVVVDRCPLCGGQHENPEIFFVDPDVLAGCQVICPVATDRDGVLRYFPLPQRRKLVVRDKEEGEDE